MKTVLTLLFCLSLPLASVYPVEKITSGNLMSVTSRAPTLVILSLGCDMGMNYVDTIAGGLGDLKGAQIAWTDINDAYGIYKGSSKPFDIGSVLLVSKGTVLESSKDFVKGMNFLQGNTVRRWAYQTLRNHKIPFSGDPLEPDFLDPLPDTGNPADLSRDQASYYPLEKDIKDVLNKGASFTAGLRNRILNQAYYLDGEYGYDSKHNFYNQADINGKNPDKGLTVFVNLKPQQPKEDRPWAYLFGLGYRMIDFYFDKSGKIFILTDVTCPKCGPNGTRKTVSGVYEIEDVVLTLDKWHSFAVSLDMTNNRAMVIIDGKRLKDVNLGKDFFKVYFQMDKSYSYYLRQHMGLTMFGNGSVYKGYARDMMTYSRTLSGKEMTLLYKKHALSMTPVTEVLPDPDNKKLNETMLLAAKKGDAGAVRSALDAGADPNAKLRGWTGLLFASYYGFEEVARAFMEKQADPLVEIEGWNAQRLAAARQHPGIVKILEEYSNTERFFMKRSFMQKKSRAEIRPPD